MIDPRGRPSGKMPDTILPRAARIRNLEASLGSQPHVASSYSEETTGAVMSLVAASPGRC